MFSQVMNSIIIVIIAVAVVGKAPVTHPVGTQSVAGALPSIYVFLNTL